MPFDRVAWHVVHYAGKQNATLFGTIDGFRVFVIEKDPASLGHVCFVLEDGCEKQIWSAGTIESAKTFCEMWWESRIEEQKKAAQAPVGSHLTGIVVDEPANLISAEELDALFQKYKV